MIDHVLHHYQPCRHRPDVCRFSPLPATDVSHLLLCTILGRNTSTIWHL